MHPYQSQLYADHYNFLRLLNFLESEIACYETDSGRYARLAVVLDIFDYVQAYPERWHHPIEDAAFELLLSKQVPDSEQILALKSEHKQLEEITRKASQLFSSVANDVVVPVDELLNVTRKFIRRQRAHMDMENKVVYPLFDDHISVAEWTQLGELVKQRTDPLFDSQTSHSQTSHSQTINQDKDRVLKEEYRNLYKLIMQAERGVAVSATARALEETT